MKVKTVSKDAGSYRSTALRRGLGLGLVFSVVEAVKNVPFSLKIHYEQPIDVILLSLVFNLFLGVLISFLASPLLRGKWGTLWHALCSLVLLSLLLFLLPSEFKSMEWVNYFVAGAVAVVFGLGLFLVRGPRTRVVSIALGTLAVIVAYAVPYWRGQGDSNVEGSREVPAEGAPNILFIVIDTVRADRLDLMGYHRETFPWLHSFAEEGATFIRALSPASWTVPAHASMFTGLFPTSHGAHHERTLLDDTNTTMAEIFRDAGWQTIALSSNPWISKSSGLAQGFIFVEPLWMTWVGPMSSLALRVASSLGLLTQDHGGRSVVDRWQKWLDARDSERPFFAYLNFLESHIPYHLLPSKYLTLFTPEGLSKQEIVRASKRVEASEGSGAEVSVEDREVVNALYDAGIRYTNDLVAEVAETLAAGGVRDNTLVIIVSDHGDLLGEHGMFGHNRSLTEYLLSVPLLMRYPARIPAGLKVEVPVTTAALLPTVLELAGLPAVENVQTESFAFLLEGSPNAGSKSPLLAEQHLDLSSMVTEGFQPRSVWDRLDVRYRSFEENGWKLVVDSTGERWLFRPSEIPSEQENLVTKNREIVRDLEDKLATLVEAYGLGPLDGDFSSPGAEVELDPEMRERLESLGYLN